MAAGYQASLASINESAFRAYFNLINALTEVHDFYYWLTNLGATDLVNVYGFDSGDAATLNGAYDDLYLLWQLFQGITTVDARQGTPYDFRSIARGLTGGQIRS